MEEKVVYEGKTQEGNWNIKSKIEITEREGNSQLNKNHIGKYCQQTRPCRRTNIRDENTKRRQLYEQTYIRRKLSTNDISMKSEMHLGGHGVEGAEIKGIDNV